MPKKTLYVSDEDEAIWTEAQKLSASGTDSLSKLATAAVSEYLAAQRETEKGDDDGDEIRVAVSRAALKPLIETIRSLIRKSGRDRFALAYARASAKEGAKSSRAGRKAAATKGPGGLKAAARAAATTRKIRGVQ